MLRIHPSGLGRIMAKPRENGKTLSEGAKTYIEELAKQHVYGFKPQINTREIQKGLIVEPESIALLNDVLFTNYAKNTERKQNDWLDGECDIAADKIHDVKSPWSLATFPATPEDGKNTGYEWQLRAYMMLWDVDRAELDYCLVDTPDELIPPYEDETLHRVSSIDPLFRVTRLHFARTQEAEDLIKRKVEAAQAYYVQAIAAIHAAHS